MMNRDKPYRAYEEDDDDNRDHRGARRRWPCATPHPAGEAAWAQGVDEIYAVIQTMSHANVGDIAKVPFCRRAALTPEQLRTLGELSCSLAHAGLGCLPVRQGEADAFYVLLHGSVLGVGDPGTPSRMSLAVGEELPTAPRADWRETEPSPAPAHAVSAAAGGAPAGAPGRGARRSRSASRCSAQATASVSRRWLSRATAPPTSASSRSSLLQAREGQLCAVPLGRLAPLERGILQHTKERLRVPSAGETPSSRS